MLGLFASIISGIVGVVGWSQDEQQEQHARKNSKEIGLSYYYDKHGKQRWTSTGRRRTPQEILQDRKDQEKERELRASHAMEEKMLNDAKKHYEIFCFGTTVTFEEFVAYFYKDRTDLNNYPKIKKIVDEHPDISWETIRGF